MSAAAAIRTLTGHLPRRCQRNAPLADLCTWRIGGPADLLFCPETEEELAQALGLFAFEECPWWLIGGGSNLLFPDEGLRGVVLRLGPGFAACRVAAPLVEAGAALAAGALGRLATEAGLAGLEFAAGIPGTVGGLVRMNAGAYGQETAQTLTRVRLTDPDHFPAWVEAATLGMGYRSCPGLGGRIVLAAEFRLAPDDPEAIRARMTDMLRRRREKQPLREASCGSVFKRPAGNYAGTLIEAAGLKGARVGQAVVSHMHANFFINEGGATARDMLALVELVKRTVRERFGVELEEEFRHVR